MVSIWFYGYDILGLRKSWQFSRNVKWQEYELMAKQRQGEGISWKADLSF